MRTEVSFQLWHSLSSMLFFEKSLYKVPLLLSFFLHKYGSCLFSRQRSMSGLSTRPNAVIFSWETTEYSMRKASLEVLEVRGESLHLFFQLRKEARLWATSYFCEGVIQALSHLYFLEYGFFYHLMHGLLTWVQKSGKIYVYKHASIHTCMHTLFGK